MKTTLRHAQAPANAKSLLPSLRIPWTCFITAFGFIASALVESRKAKVASDLYQRLSQMSDADLAKIGITRRTIAKHIHERLWGSASR